VAPRVELINVRVGDEWGSATESDVVAGLQWVYDHKDEYNIRIVNLSMNSTVAQSYHTSPLDAAAEILWFNGVVVVVSAGNNGDDAPGIIYPPANDPFVIAVGAMEDLGTPEVEDDIVAEFSAYGTTPEGFFRPDLAAPGTYLVSSLGAHTHFERDYPDHVVKTVDSRGNLVKTNFVASGTSVSAGVVSGVAALLLSAMPDLNPDQVKYLLMSTATPMPCEPGAGAGVVNAANLIRTALSYRTADAVPTTNTGLPASQLLWGGPDPVAWDSVNWDSVNWDSVNWDSVNWDSVNWDSVNWDSVDLDY
jgi:serine protease AprX